MAYINKKKIYFAGISKGISERYTDGVIIEDIETEVSLITFTIDGTSYQAEEDMTWGEWVDSEYNTAGYLIEDPYVKFPPASGAMVGPYVSTSTSGATNYFVEITDTILANTTYYHINYGGGAGD